ncbi:MAG TPA: methionine--tRNA ligase [Spirochaetota bacterium]|nr:methionine--tRNA ligase [Spirochaetota bacterium]HOL56603.1 methionine--tRNA ligase [Spirochaetota bacterium]HPP04026.1 methionine--tRNA ligase [Spirochaetota bacterium]
MKKKRLITSALPYVNNIPHLGNIIGCVLSADVFARYCKIANYETLFVCGNDEYGTTTETKALQEGLTPKDLCDKYHKIHKEIYDWFNIDFSVFGRTSHPKQTEIVQSIFWKLYENGYIVEGLLIQPYCEHCKMFLADRFVEGICPYCGYEMAKGDQCENCGKLLDPAELKEPKCTICKKPPVFKETKHLFLDLETLKPELEKWVNTTAEKNNWSYNALSVTKGWIDLGLKKRCITRDLKWGVPVPLKGYEDKVFYVWFDAPIGYISITASKYDNWEEWWKNPENVDLYQFMGKDNIPFHTVLFPASLMGTKENWTMLKTISSTEYLNYEDLKFSKSRGTGVFGDQAKDTGIDPDLFRYYLLRIRPEKNDTNFFWNDFMEKTNGEIIANYGNLVNRILQFIDRFFDGLIPDITELNSEYSVFSIVDINKEKEKIINDFENIELKNCLLDILEISSIGNKFFQDKEPWKVVKENKETAKIIIGSLLFLIKDISIMLYPYIPKTIEKFFATINVEKEKINFNDIENYSYLKNKKINKPIVLFNKLEKDKIEELRKKFSGSTNMTEESLFPVLLKTGKILEIKRHPKADKLYIEKVDLGNGEIRQIVSGLVPYYKEEELLNKTIVVVTNLKEAILRGEKSQGMLLAAQNEDGTIVEVLSPDAVPGTIVLPEGLKESEVNKKEISIDEFFNVKIDVRESKIFCNNKPLVVNNQPIKVEKVKNGIVK